MTQVSEQETPVNAGPVSVAAKLLSMVEILIYYFSMVLILSDCSLWDSIIEERTKHRAEERIQ